MGDGAESSTHDSYFLFHYDDATSSWLLYGYTQRYPYPQNQIQMDANGVWETTAKRFGDTDFHGDESYKLVLMDVPGPDPVSHFTIVYID